MQSRFNNIPGLIYFSPGRGQDFIHLDRVLILSMASPDFILVRKASPVRVRILSISSPDPDTIKHVRVRVHVRILPMPIL